MLKYTEVVTNLNFNKVLTLPSDIQVSIVLDSDMETEDCVYVISEIGALWRLLDLDKYRLQPKN